MSADGAADGGDRSRPSARRAATGEQLLKAQRRLLKSIWLRRGVLSELQAIGLTTDFFDGVDQRRIYETLGLCWAECDTAVTQPVLELRLGGFADTLLPIADACIGPVSGGGAVRLFEELRAQLSWRAASEAQKRAKIALDHEDFDEALVQINRSREQRAAAVSGSHGGPTSPRYMSLADSMLALVQPVSARLSSGLETLDRATRGGLPLGRVVTLVGAPGAGKTGLAVWFAEQWERAGAAVAFLAADEEPRGILTRIGQRMGFSRDDIEGPDDGVRRDLASQCVGRSVIVIDPDADESMRTIEDAHAALVHFACELPRVLIIDSLQTCLCAAAMSCDTIRERISTKMRVVKSFAKTGTLVVVISEMARAGYRSGDAKNDVSALAAGKESSDIEYGSALLLGLRSVRDTSGQTDVEVAKNRLGAEKPTFRLRLDFATAGWSEIATPAEPDKGGAAEDERDAKAEQIIRDVIAAHPGKLASQNAVLAVARGMKRAVMNRALGRLITIGDVRLVDSVYVVDGLGSTRGET